MVRSVREDERPIAGASTWQSDSLANELARLSREDLARELFPGLRAEISRKKKYIAKLKGLLESEEADAKRFRWLIENAEAADKALISDNPELTRSIIDRYMAQERAS